jgi:suppressor of fused protein SUFU
VDDANEGTDAEAPGWDAIDAALRRLYGSATPRHVGYMPPAAFSANLQGCSAYAAQGHWHYVTYGLSELYMPAPDSDREVSGWGFELTMRVPRGSEATAPGWPFTMLNELAKHVNTNRVLLESGDRIDMRSPVTGHPHVPDAPSTNLTVYAVTIDPQLGRISTPNGTVQFLQVVGVTDAEKEQMLASSTADVLAGLASDNWLLITDPHRA